MNLANAHAKQRQIKKKDKGTANVSLQVFLRNNLVNFPEYCFVTKPLHIYHHTLIMVISSTKFSENYTVSCNSKIRYIDITTHPKPIRSVCI